MFVGKGLVAGVWTKGLNSGVWWPLLLRYYLATYKSCSSVPGILQAITLEWVAISFSIAWKWKVKMKSLSQAQLSFLALWTVSEAEYHNLVQPFTSVSTLLV